MISFGVSTSPLSLLKIITYIFHKKWKLFWKGTVIKMMPVEISKGILQNAYIYQYPPTRVMQVFFSLMTERFKH
jgi:hypothetical protein